MAVAISARSLAHLLELDCLLLQGRLQLLDLLIIDNGGWNVLFSNTRNGRNRLQLVDMPTAGNCLLLVPLAQPPELEVLPKRLGMLILLE